MRLHVKPITFRAAGRAIGGGSLIHAKRGRHVIATINHTLGFWMVQPETPEAPLGSFKVCHSFSEARNYVRREWRA